MDLKNLIFPIKNKVESSHTQYAGEIGEISKELTQLSSIANSLDDFFYGSWLNDAANLYTPNFDSSEKGAWARYSYEEITEQIEGNVEGITLVGLEEELSPIVKDILETNDRLLSDLSIIRNMKNFETECELFNKIESIHWNPSVSTFDEFQSPKQMIVSDPSVLNKGRKVPPHIRYKSRIFCQLANISAIQEFFQLSKRLLRQLEIKMQFNFDNDQEQTIDNVRKICKRFSIVARQLQDRHENRETLSIDDEYDVQDLFHTLLKIFFDDIRKEEWTPTYAGGAVRMDFLLKKEKIVIEIKKTRQNLKDKEIGNQLLLDIAKYESNPDCKILICFIYDPDGRIGNSPGLINDLNQKSTEKMQVLILIEPA
jgi:hypothetical protein